MEGLQKFYLEYQCGKSAASSKDFSNDLAKAFQVLISHFEIQDATQAITDEMFNDPNSAEFRFILFLYSMKPAFTKMIMGQLGD